MKSEYSIIYGIFLGFRIGLFLVGFFLVITGLFGMRTIPISLEQLALFLDDTFWRLIRIVFGFLMMMIAISPRSIVGFIGLIVSR